MRCFYHPQVDAVAICKNCNKGLCLTSASDIGDGVACKDRCETEVRAINDMVHRGKRVKGFYRVCGAVFGLLGLMCVVGGVQFWKKGEGLFSVVVGGLFVLVASSMIFLTRKGTKRE